MAVNRDFSKNYSLGGGELFIMLPGSGNFEYFGQTTAFNVNVSVDKIEHKNSEGEALVTDMEVVKEISGEVTIQTEDFDKKILALAFGGEYVENTQVAGSIADQEFSTVEGGKRYELGKIKVSNVVVTYNDGNSDVQAIEGVDYSVDYEFGIIEIAKGGALEGKDIKVDYDYAAATSVDIKTLNKLSQEVALQFIQKAQVGQAKKVDIFKTKLLIDGDFALKATDNFASITLKGKILKDDTKPEGEQFLKITTVA